EEEGPLIEEPGDRFSFAALWWNGLSDYKLYKELDDENFEEEIKSTNSPPKPNTNCEITIHSTADTTKISQIIKNLVKVNERILNLKFRIMIKKIILTIYHM